MSNLNLPPVRIPVGQIEKGTKKMKSTNEEVVSFAIDLKKKINENPEELTIKDKEIKTLKRIITVYLAQNCAADDQTDAPYPYNLIETVFQGDADVSEFTQDNLDGFDLAMTKLDYREKTVLERHYRDGLTLDEIGKGFGISRERARQIEAKAIRKLRHPSRANLILNGKEAEDTRYCEKIREIRLQKEKEIIGDIDLSVMNRRNELVDVLKRFDRYLGIEENYDRANPAAKPVFLEDAGLSIRAYNVLRRAGIKELDDLKSYSVHDLSKLRNLGKRSLDEILAKLAEHGIVLEN